MKTQSHILFWIATIFVSLFLVPVVIPPEAAKLRVTKEQAAAAAIFGVDATNGMTDRANAIYDLLINQSGASAFMDKAYTTEEEVRDVPITQETQRSVGSSFNRYLWSGSILIYGLVFRLNIMLYWLLYVGIFLIAAAIDGQTQRKIKNDSVVALSPVKFALALHAIIAIVFVPILYMVLPVHVSPWFMPVWAAVVAWPLSKAVANASGFD